MTYPAGEPIEFYFDYLPAKIEPLPEGVPAGRSYRIVVTRDYITVMWQNSSSSIGRVDVPVENSQIQVNYTGGTAGDYVITKAGGCGCGMALLKGTRPWPNNPYEQTSIRGAVAVPYGVPPPRDPGRWYRA